MSGYRICDACWTVIDYDTSECTVCINRERIEKLEYLLKLDGKVAWVVLTQERLDSIDKRLEDWGIIKNDVEPRKEKEDSRLVQNQADINIEVKNRLDSIEEIVKRLDGWMEKHLVVHVVINSERLEKEDSETSTTESDNLTDFPRTSEPTGLEPNSDIEKLFLANKEIKRLNEQIESLKTGRDSPDGYYTKIKNALKYIDEYWVNNIGIFNREQGELKKILEGITDASM
jgi:hypothetical protein